MSQEIAVIGSPDFTTGFRLAGVRKYETVSRERKDEKLDAIVSETLADDSVGIVIMHDDDLEYLSRGIRNDVETSVEPVVVTVGGGTGGGALREQIKRAIGIDLMEEDENNE